MQLVKATEVFSRHELFAVKGTSRERMVIDNIGDEPPLVREERVVPLDEGEILRCQTWLLEDGLLLPSQQEAILVENLGRVGRLLELLDHTLALLNVLSVLLDVVLEHTSLLAVHVVLGALVIFLKVLLEVLDNIPFLLNLFFLALDPELAKVFHVRQVAPLGRQLVNLFQLLVHALLLVADNRRWLQLSERLNRAFFLGLNHLDVCEEMVNVDVL